MLHYWPPQPSIMLHKCQINLLHTNTSEPPEELLTIPDLVDPQVGCARIGRPAVSARYRLLKSCWGVERGPFCVNPDYRGVGPVVSTGF
jgi:hypothetical protein